MDNTQPMSGVRWAEAARAKAHLFPTALQKIMQMQTAMYRHPWRSRLALLIAPWLRPWLYRTSLDIGRAEDLASALVEVRQREYRTDRKQLPDAARANT